MKFALFLLLTLAVSTLATVYYDETFEGEWEKRWIKSSKSEGKMTVSSGAWNGGDEEKAKGLQTSQDAKFYHWSSKMDEPFTNEGKDAVLQFTVKHEQGIDCGGGYIKVLPTGLKQDSFNGDSEYNIMFGPDICGPTKKIHLIFTYEGKNHLWKKTPACGSDKLTHIYTMILHPDNTYEVKMDQKVVESGKLEEDWEMLKPKEIPDPEASKPEDWVDDAMIPDPEDVKPEGYDDIPEVIPDADAVKPDDWDDEFDGEWEAPEIPNPEYRGEWKPKMIENPDYKGPWVHPKIPNPDFTEDENLYIQKDMEFVGFDLWQVKSGSIFDNILLTDDVDLANERADEIMEFKKAEEEVFNKIQEEERIKAEAEAKAQQEAQAEQEAEESDSDSDSDVEDEKDEL